MPQDQQPKTEFSLEEFEERARERYGVPKGLWESLKSQESGGDVNAVSPTGVKGRFQMTRRTAAGFGLDRDDPFHQAVAAAKYLREGYDKYSNLGSDNQRWLAAAGYYYGGPSAVKEDGSISAESKDNLSNPQAYVTKIAKRWKDYETAQPQPTSTARQMGLKPAEGMTFDLSKPERTTRRQQRPTPLLPRPARQPRPTRPTSLIADIENQMRQRDMKEQAIGETKARLGKLSRADLQKEHARLSKIFATVPETRQTRLEEERQREAYYAQPLLTRIGQEADVALAGVGESLNRAASRIAQPVMRAVGLDEAANAWQRATARQSAIQAQRQAEQERIANRLSSKVARGLTGGGAQAAVALPVAMTTGPVGVTALTALQSDVERDPGGALAATIGAPLAMAAGGAISPAASRVAGRLASPVAQKAAQLGIEGAAGGLTNVGQYAATSAALGRPITAEDLAEQAITGGVLGTTMAPRMRGTQRISGISPQILESAAGVAPRPPRLPRTPDAATQAVADFGNRLADIDQMVPANERPAAIEAARQEFAARRQAARTPQEVAAPEAAPVVEAPQPVLPEGVSIIRQGEQIPPAVRGQRRIPLDIQQPDGSVETVLVITPGILNNRRVNETMLRPIIEQALRPQVPSSPPQPTTAPEAVPAGFEPPRASRPPVQFFPQQRIGRAILAPKSPVAGRKLLPPARGEEILPTEPLTEPLGVREVISRPDPRFQPKPPDAPPTQRIPVPDAPPTQKMAEPPIAPVNQRLIERTRAKADELIQQGKFTDAIAELKAHQRALREAMAKVPRGASGERVRLEREIGQVGARIGQVRQMAREEAKGRKAMENAPTAELPAQSAGQRRTAQAAEAALIEEPTNRIMSGEGAELPRGVSRPLEGQPVEIPGPRRPRTERLPVPEATEANIATLRARREALSRLAYDRRGELPADLGDELRELGSRIIEFENEQAKVARGGRPDFAPPPGVGGPERTMTPEEKGARRAALAVKPEAETGRKINHSQFGEVAEAADQAGVPKGKLRVVDAAGDAHIIQNPRARGGGNRNAAFVKREAPTGAIPAEAMPELREPNAPPSPLARMGKEAPVKGERTSYAIPEEAAPELARRTKPKFVSDAEQRLKDAASGKLAGSGGQQLVDTAIVTGWKVYEKGMDFARWSAEVVKQAGEKVRPHLRAAWDQIQADYNKMAQEVATRKATAKAGAQIASRMARIARTPTSPVEISKLRAEFPNLSKSQFDAAMQRLNAEGRISLQRHDYPQSLSEAERAKMVKIGDDYFTAATIRPREGTVIGFGFGGLQGMFGKRSQPKAKPTKQDIEGASLGRAIGNTLKSAGNNIRTLWTAADFSAPLSQGALLTLAHPIKGAQSFKRMFQSLSEAQSDAIDTEIAFHPLRKLGEDAGLFLATTGKLQGEAAGMEEAYRATRLQEAPIIRQTERAYRTYLDTLRLSTWETYVKALEASGKTIESDPKAYRDAAAFINIATGRGQLRKGGAAEKASDLLGSVLFAPRNLVANFQVLDPVRYMTLAPGARKLVLRDAMTAFGVMLGTAAALNAAGVKVGFNAEDDDFMIARWGNTRYDLTFGKRTQVQFLARLVKGLYRQKTGEGNLPGRDPMSITERFITGKLSPLLSTAKTFATGKDFKGESIADKSKSQIAWETAAPMLWRDLAEAAKEEGVKGVLKSSPAIFGGRVNTYPDRAKAAFLDVPANVRSEQRKLDQNRPYILPHRAKDKTGKDETPEAFEARRAKANEWWGQYSGQLLGSRQYQNATAEQRAAALEYLKRTISTQTNEKRPHLYLLRPSHVMRAVRRK